MNANELKSVIDVVTLAATQQDQTSSSNLICAPDIKGKLVSVSDLLQNDQPWLVSSQRLDLSKIHLCHPKMNQDLMTKLQIPLMSKRVHEVLDDQYPLIFIPTSRAALLSLQEKIQSDNFIFLIEGLIPKSLKINLQNTLKSIQVKGVEEIRTRFILIRNNGSNSGIDITNTSTDSSSFCFINKENILVSNLPHGVSCELVVANALCDKFGILRQYVAGVTALLSSPSSSFNKVQHQMGIFGDEFKEELFRGEPGQPLVSTDEKVASIKPLKVFKQGEIVAVRSSVDSNQLIYGIVKDFQDSSSLSRLSISVGRGKDEMFLTSDIFSLGRSKREESVKPQHKEIDVPILRGDVILNHDQNYEIEQALVEHTDESLMKPVTRADVLTAVQDLLQSADMSLNDNAQSMLDSNLSLQESLAQKDREIQVIEKRNSDIARKALKGVDSFLCPITRVCFSCFHLFNLSYFRNPCSHICFNFLFTGTNGRSCHLL